MRCQHSNPRFDPARFRAATTGDRLPRGLEFWEVATQKWVKVEHMVYYCPKCRYIYLTREVR